MKKILFSTIIFVSLSLVSVFAEVEVESPTSILPEINYSGSPSDAVGAVIAWMIRITAVLSIIAITWAGIQMVIATGEDEKVKKARYMIIYAFIGLIIAGLAYAIVTTVAHTNLNLFF